ncbi:P-loop containing nucleoside triphosphate hydrolases superfamily protein [Striga hermonthica]|uniref:P-loop containing nucleoside triphosphate hydrolases superfamily protein n=1 Tax=Striga hermonthica TaxID=68872 RepID=A0A9N7NGV4_STRHE|nr:P-loop containing nucleoside triphosphate hydrolases superfamily protein [Striga hermonthica]
MAKNDVTRKELLERWGVIEQEDDGNDAVSNFHPVKRRRLRQLKERWFSDAFSFLIYLPKETHVWCGYWDLMGPLLETFYNYFKDEGRDSPLKLLWSRISEEMRSCTLCIHQHHQAQEMYASEYEQSCISPLLDVLRVLDEERISLHLVDLNARIVTGEYDTDRDYGEVVSVMFEVLTFPILLDDLSLATEFQIFIEAVDNSHELTLDGHQQYPGVYALLFLKSRRVRSIGLRLAGHIGKLRRSSDLEPLQHLLKKCICILETEGVQVAAETSRPRVQLDRITVWLGMKALVGFLEPPAFEEGILDRYPIFLSIVLNHISDDSLEFSHAVNCLRLLFEKLGCKLWLRATLSPSVMRNTLLGQCFHTRNEKSHKEIFDLFQPFLQSLEALQDGEHEKQRRHFLYFLLHQVPVSSNFSTLMRKKACQIALLIVLRGYMMDPPCPPSECAHMWGPSLVSSLKDSSLHTSLRQPAIDLIQTIIVSDACAFISVILNGQLHPSDKPVRPTNCDVDDDEEILSGFHIEKKDDSCWNEFMLQHKIISQVDGSWMCVPMLWFDVLVDTDPLVLPVSFSKATFWALSRFSLIEPENSSEMTLSVRNWLATCASEVSYLFGWKVPSGSDDGGDGTESRNSIRISTMCLPLVRTFKRLTAHYIIRMEQGELRKQWIWEPMMSNSLILFLVDPNDNTRQVGKIILEQISNRRGLTSGLQFLCSIPSSLFAVLLGLTHALKLVQLDSVLSNFQTLHHLFFILCKLLKEGNSSSQTMQKSSGVTEASRFSEQGGFLVQPILDSSHTDGDTHFSIVTSETWKKFSCLLSQVAWRSILKCLDGGKPFTDYSVSQMTCIRLLEVMPIVFEKLPDNSVTMLKAYDSLKWLHDLADWGKSSLAVVNRYWRLTLTYLLGQFRASCSNKSASAIRDIEKLVSHEKVSMDELSKQVARLSVSLIDENSALNKSHPSEESEILVVDAAERIRSEALADLDGGQVIILSDDENETEVSTSMGFSNRQSIASAYDDNHVDARYAGELEADPKEKESGNHYTGHFLEKVGSDTNTSIQTIQSPVQAKPSESRREEFGFVKKHCVADSFLLKDNSNLTKISDRTVSSKQIPSHQYSSSKTFDTTVTPSSNVRKVADKSLKTRDEVLKEIVSDTDGEAWNFAFFKPPRRPQTLITKPNTSGPKRQVIQLSLPLGNRPGSMRMGDKVKRFQPPRLDDWYRPILELDFFVAVGLASGDGKENQNVGKLKEVPVCFPSPDGYVEIFRPLILEEFKAQLQSSYQEMASSEEMCFGSLSVLSVERIDEFHVVRFVHDESGSTASKSLLENDLILLTKQPLRNSVVDVHTVGKVERREKDNKKRLNILAVRLYLQGCSRLDRARKFLTERSKWYVSRIMSITPQLREFQALSSIKEIPLLPIILNPANHACGESKVGNLSKLSQSLQQIFRTSYNDSQLQAISLSIGPFDLKKDFELNLIQGPPGTGKTRTIVAMVSGLLAFSQMDSRRVRNYESMPTSSSSRTNQKVSQSAAIARAWQDAALARQLNEDVKNNMSTGSCSRGRILICAQSNAAVDELVARISSEGLYGCDGQMFKPYLVRVGNPKTVHLTSLPYFIDTLVENRLAEEKKNAGDENSADSLTIIRSNLEKLVDRIRYYEAKRASLEEGNSDSKILVEGDGGDAKVLSDADLKVKLRQLYEKKKATYADLASVQAREKKANEEMRALRHKLRTAILKEAEIVVTTLSGCGGDVYTVCSEHTSGHKFINVSENALFDALVIDEAAQALEPATLIPFQLLKSRGSKCVMVGDPKQLPATVLSNVASKYLFQCSMFERFQRAGHPVIMLTEQYRMHPEICRFPSSHFYEGKLLNGKHMTGKTASFHETWCLGPYVFFDITDGQELRGKNAASLSLYNESEADAAVELLRYFKKSHPSEFYGGRIGVITPYKRQLSLLRSRFSSAFGSSMADDMEFNTVDGFQGREVDILILSTVRASGSGSETPGYSNLGFVSDVRRMNVALTRARISLWVFGNAKTLQANRSWAALVDDAKQRNLIISGRKPYSSICKCGPGGRRDEPTFKSGNTQKKITKHASERTRQSTETTVSESARTDAGKDDNKRATEGTNISQAKELVSASASDSRKNILKGATLKLDENREKTAKSYAGNSEEKPSTMEKGCDDNRRHSANYIGKAKSKSQKHQSPVCDDTRLKPNKHDKPPGARTATSSSERSIKEKRERGDSNEVDLRKDSIMKRKQQREAIDALLPSALISSRKSESLAKSTVKRTRPATDPGAQPVRPPKRRSGHDSSVS